MRVVIVGGTGPFGTALAVRLREAEHDVVIGSRDGDRAAAAAAELGVEGASNDDAVRSAELVVLATKADAALETARLLRGAIGSTPLLSVASQLVFTPRGVLPSPEPMSLAERVQSELDGPVVAGLHSLAASTLASAEPPDEDAFVCGDDLEAKRLALGVAEQLIAGRAFDAGPLASARALEGMIAVAINLNKLYRGHAGLRVTGLP
jgi:NADPH-dependent F420 reductase